MNLIERVKDKDSNVILSLPHSGLLSDWGVDTPGHTDFEMPTKDLPPFVKEVGKVFQGDSGDIIDTARGGVDIAVPAMLDWKNLQGYNRIWTRMPRFIFDVNRSQEDIDEMSVKGAKTENRHPQGAIWRSVISKTRTRFGYFLAMLGITKKESLLKRPYTQEEFEELSRLFYISYINSVRKTAKSAIETHGDAIIIDLHTFPPLMPGAINKGPDKGGYIVGPPLKGHGKLTPKNLFIKKQFPDVIMITNADPDGTPQSCHPKIADIIRDGFEGEGLIVATGKGPFKGNKGSTVLYGEEKSHVVGLEVISHGFEVGRGEGALKVDVEKITAVRTALKKILLALNGWTKTA